MEESVVFLVVRYLMAHMLLTVGEETTKRASVLLVNIHPLKLTIKPVKSLRELEQLGLKLALGIVQSYTLQFPVEST